MRIIAVINGKGGVGKTSLATILAALFALAGLRVLLVDVDPQGNCGRDLGYLKDGRSDEGRGLFAALTLGVLLQPLRNIRANLDVIAAGQHTGEIVGALSRRHGDTSTALRDALHRLNDSLPTDERYEIVLMDCPPGEEELQRMAVTAARWLLIPSTADEAGVDGLGKVARLFAAVRETTNPAVELLGIVAFRIGSRSTGVFASFVRSVASTGLPPELVFPRWIRTVELPAVTVRATGQLPHELEQGLDEARAARLRWLRDRGKDGATTPPPAPATSTPGLAEDYQVLSELITDRMLEGEAA